MHFANPGEPEKSQQAGIRRADGASAISRRPAPWKNAAHERR
jgi:hypothetical protein